MFAMVPVSGRPGELRVHYSDVVDVPASAAALFSVLEEIDTWNRWFTGMRKVRIDGARRGPGALRTVWVGATSVQERFDVWEPGERLGLSMTAMNLPGLKSMAEEWQVAPTGETSSRLTITVGFEPRFPLRPLGSLLRAVVHSATRGGANIVSMFPAS